MRRDRVSVRVDRVERAGRRDARREDAELVDLFDQRLGVGHALARLFFEQVVRDRLEAIGRAQRRRGLERVFVQHLAHVAAERHLAPQHLVQHTAERVEVGARGDLLAAQLFGRHVIGRAHRVAGLGELVRAERVVALDRHQAEVEDLRHFHAVLLNDHDVARLEVAVDHPELVRRPQTRRQLTGEQRRADRSKPGAIVDELRQRLAGQQLHDHERHALGGRAVVEDRHDVAMIDSGDRLRLSPESLGHLAIRGHLAEQDLHRPLPTDLGVHRAIDAGHTPFAKALDDAIAVQLDADHRVDIGRHQLRAVDRAELDLTVEDRSTLGADEHPRSLVIHQAGDMITVANFSPSLDVRGRGRFPV